MVVRSARVIALLLLAHAAGARTFVVANQHPRAADTNAGTAEQPLRTITAAAAQMQPGDTVQVRAGTYREQFTLPAGTEQAPVSLEAWPGEKPVVKGSDLATGPWTRAEGLPAGIYVTPWEPYTQMCFCDGKPLAQIGPWEHFGPHDWPNFAPYEGKGPADMRPATYHYDKEKKQLCVWLPNGDAPSKHSIEVSVRYGGIAFKDYAHVRGMEARHCQCCADVNKGHCGIGGGGTGIVVENCRALENDFTGLLVQGTDCIVRNNELAYNGNSGLISSHGLNITFEGNDVHHNNVRHYGFGWNDGGIKVHEWRECKFIRNHFHDQRGTGLWCDISCVDGLLVENLLERCDVGIYWEIARWGVIANNVAIDCGRGYWIYSSDSLLTNNVADRCGEGIVISGEIRGAEYSRGYPEPSNIVVGATRNNLAVNNLLIDCPGLYVGITKESVHCDSNLSDYNVFAWTLPAVDRSSGHIKFNDAERWYPRLTEWRWFTHMDTHTKIADAGLLRNVEQDRGPQPQHLSPADLVGDPGLVDRAKGDYRLRPDSPLLKLGIAIPDELDSIYQRGVHAYGRTQVKDAAPVKSPVVFNVWNFDMARIQPWPEPKMMLDPDRQAPAAPGLNETWLKTAKYPRFRRGTGPIPVEPPYPTATHYDNLCADPQLAKQPYGPPVAPWAKVEGNFHAFDQMAIASLADYSQRIRGRVELVGVVEPGTVYVVDAQMLVRCAVPKVTATGGFSFAWGDALTPVGEGVAVTCEPEKTVSWRTYRATWHSGAAGADPAVGQKLYLVFTGQIAGEGICPNGGAPNAQAFWDNLVVWSEQR
ncbi:MAG: right-handed parallel beta-helix repeat-containing protein [Armatimonadetes bacterium]|nr:right-handed parallel beta-helix repeat-containing protein [Armatimonadota bacterium]